MDHWRSERRTTTRRGAVVATLALVFVLPVPARWSGRADAAPEPAVNRTQLEFKRHGEVTATLDRKHLLARVKAESVRVREPYEDRTVEFSALPLAAVLDSIYSPSWRQEQELLFTCRDGYQPTVPVKRVLDHEAWLAFARPGSDSFSILKRESGEMRNVDLGPYYVVWSNLDDSKILQEGDYGWPYQVVAIDLIDRHERFRKMTPPNDASAEVIAGFDAFRIHCSKCHPVNGEGGAIGPELNPAPGSGEYYDAGWLKTWIEEPTKIRPNTRMPALNPNLPRRARVADEIVAYLEAMAALPPKKTGTDATTGH